MENAKQTKSKSDVNGLAIWSIFNCVLSGEWSTVLRYLLVSQPSGILSIFVGFLHFLQLF